MEPDIILRERCRVCTNTEGDRFVGVRETPKGVTVCFPLGYRLSASEEGLRRDVLQLMSVLEEFLRSPNALAGMGEQLPQFAAFPAAACLELISDYLRRGSWYTEREAVYRAGGRGSIDWGRTIRRELPLFQPDGSPVYTRYTVRVSSPNERGLLTQIHRHCVYESFRRLGWLFTPGMPPKPEGELEVRRFLSVVGDKLARTNNDREKRLFSAMSALLAYLGGEEGKKEFLFGTGAFEYVWEWLVDQLFGIRDKVRYFPTTHWRLGSAAWSNRPLEPDTIMLLDSGVYVLDAKYYRYGVTGDPFHLPGSSSIGKQIIYGEQLASREDLRRRYGGEVPVYNAFLMPWDSGDSPQVYKIIGEATASWRSGLCPYERIQGILVDTRYLMHHYRRDRRGERARLAGTIRQMDTR